MKNRVISVVLIAIMIISVLFGCSKQTEEPPTVLSAEKSAETLTNETPTDPPVTTITIKGIEYGTDLIELDLREMELTDSDIEPLKYMTKLTVLYLFGNQISDISVLGNLINLESLLLDNNPISDIIVLKNLTNLTELFLDRNQSIESQIEELQSALPNCAICLVG